MAKYNSNYNFDFEIPMGYEQVEVDKSSFSNSIATFGRFDKPKFSLLFEGTTIRGTNQVFFDFINEKYNKNNFSIVAQKELKIFLGPENESVLEVALHNAKLGKNFICFFFRYDELFNYVGGFVFEHNNGVDANVYRKIVETMFVTKTNPLPYKKVELDPNVIIN